MCAAIPVKDRDTGETRILKAGTINKNRKIQFPAPVKRSLFDPGVDPANARIVWHLLDVPEEDRPAMLVISNGEVGDPHVKNTWETSDVLAAGRYLRPPDGVTELSPGSFEHGKQTIAAFIAQILGHDEAKIREAYDPDHSFFRSQEEYTEALDEKIPRYVFYVSHEYRADERSVDYYFMMSQEVFSYSSRETRELMLLHGNILEDDRIFAVLDEMARADQFTPDISLFQ